STGTQIANTPSITQAGISAGNQKVTNVADGTVAAGSKDAVNGGQLANVQSQVTANTNNISNLQNNISDVTSGKTGIVKQADANSPITIGQDTGGTTVNVAGTSGNRTVTGVANGSVAQGSTDAINGGQLSNVSNSVASVIGGDATVDADGKVTATNIGGTGATTVDQAIKNVNQSAAKAKSTVTQGDNIVVTTSNNADGSTNYQVATSKDITANTVKVGQVEIDSNGVNAGNQKVTNVADGSITSSSKDAVNGAQVYQANTNVSNYLGGGSTVDASTGQVSAPTYNVAGGAYNNVGDALGAVDKRVDTLENAFAQTNRGLNELRRDTSAGIAGAMAVGNLPQPSEPGLSMVSAGLGGYKGEGAIAVGASAITDNNKYIWKLGASADSRSNVGGAVSVGYQWK
uniref:YadA C-terminal domain-containing protein n=1 Tax=Acinetobacter sp. HY1485 TaxID=2970918 RepID=UPI0022B99B99